MASRYTPSVRQPVSCEPCRRRKIKCSRTRPPCDTCSRRGLPESCVYKGTRDEPLRPLPVPPNEELLNRINHLETLLLKHTGAQVPTPNARMTSPMISPPTKSTQMFHPSPESFISDNSSPRTLISERSTSRGMGVGVLTTSPNGNVRYEPKSSQWSSVLANTALSIATPSLDDQDDSSLVTGFPFTSAPISSVDELISMLPPMQQCDYLKDRYFAVFSPVSWAFTVILRLLFTFQ
jgi:hypothetical protein